MAAKSVQDLIHLLEKVKAAADLADRGESLEQACREAQARLENLRDQESAAGRAVAGARADADRAVAAAHESANRSVAAVKAKADEAIAAARDDAAVAEAETAGKLADLDEQIEKRSARVGELEAEESALGQSVAALRADLAAIRAKLG